MTLFLDKKGEEHDDHEDTMLKMLNMSRKKSPVRKFSQNKTP